MSERFEPLPNNTQGWAVCQRYHNTSYTAALDLDNPDEAATFKSKNWASYIIFAETESALREWCLRRGFTSEEIAGQRFVWYEYIKTQPWGKVQPTPQIMPLTELVARAAGKAGDQRPANTSEATVPAPTYTPEPRGTSGFEWL